VVKFRKINLNIMSIKKQNQSKKEVAFPKNEVMMILKNMSGGIEVIAESQKQSIQNQNELKDNLENFKVEIKSDLLDFRIETGNNFKEVKSDLLSFKKETKNNFRKNDKKFEQIFKSLNEIKREVKDIRKELDEMKKQPVIRREEFDILVKRVEVVEMSVER